MRIIKSFITFIIYILVFVGLFVLLNSAIKYLHYCDQIQYNDYIYIQSEEDRELAAATEELINQLPEKDKSYIINHIKIIISNEYKLANDENETSGIHKIGGVIYINPDNTSINYLPTVVYHEVGHAIQYKNLAFNKSIYEKYITTNEFITPGEYLINDPYSKTNINEFYANSYAMYMLDEEYLQTFYEDIYEWITEA